jgi:zinc transporter 1/2/3
VRSQEIMESSSHVPYLRAHLQRIAASSLSTASCAAPSSGGEACRDEAAALGLKMIAVAAILVSGAAGVAIPLLGRCWRGRDGGGGGGLFVLAKAFAAGVILATGFVHVLPDADEALRDHCLPTVPWRKFPFPGFFAMLAALGTLVVDFVGTHMYERKHAASEEDRETAAAAADNARAREEIAAALLEDGALAERGGDVEGRRSGGGNKEDAAMHIVGVHAHAAAHRHRHAHGHGSCHGGPSYDSYGHGHGHGEEPSQARHAVVAQVRCSIILSLRPSYH